MLYNELSELGLLEDEAIVLEPRAVFNSAILGASVDGCHLIYDYERAAKALQNNAGLDAQEAYEYLEYNTLRALEYTPADFRPIFIRT